VRILMRGGRADASLAPTAGPDEGVSAARVASRNPLSRHGCRRVAALLSTGDESDDAVNTPDVPRRFGRVMEEAPRAPPPPLPPRNPKRAPDRGLGLLVAAALLFAASGGDLGAYCARTTGLGRSWFGPGLDARNDARDDRDDDDDDW